MIENGEMIYMCDKYVCPECGEKIEYWYEFYLEERRKINPKTGKFGRITKTKPQPSDLHGFKCTECNWCINRDECTEDLEVIYRMMIESQYDK